MEHDEAAAGGGNCFKLLPIGIARPWSCWTSTGDGEATLSMNACVCGGTDLIAVADCLDTVVFQALLWCVKSHQ